MILFYMNGTYINTLGTTNVISINTSLLMLYCDFIINNNVIKLNCDNGWNINFNLP